MDIIIADSSHNKYANIIRGYIKQFNPELQSHFNPTETLSLNLSDTIKMISTDAALNYLANAINSEKIFLSSKSDVDKFIE